MLREKPTHLSAHIALAPSLVKQRIAKRIENVNLVLDMRHSYAYTTHG